MSSWEVKVDGFDELQETLKKLIKLFGDEHLEPIFLEAARMFSEEVKKTAPEGPTGNIKKAVTAKLMPRSDSFPVVAIAAIDSVIAPHAHLVEYGSGPRFIKSTGKFVGAMPANPFFRYTWDMKQRETYRYIVKELEKLLEKGVR